MQARLVALVTCNRAYNCAARKQSEVVQDARLITIIPLIGQLASYPKRTEARYRILRTNALHTIGRNTRTTNYFTHVIRPLCTYVRTTNGITPANFRQFRIISRSRVEFPSPPIHRRTFSEVIRLSARCRTLGI